MASAHFALLLLVLLTEGGRSIEGSGAASTVIQAGFDFKLCKERLCLVNKGCTSTPIDKDFHQSSYKEEKPCKILLAIWPYSEKKWRVTLQAKIATKKITMQIVDSDTKAVKQKIVTCGVNSTGGVGISETESPYSTELIPSHPQVNSIFCDFFLFTKSNEMITGTWAEIRSQTMQLSYGATAAETISMLMVFLDANLVETRASFCNPDTIKFDQSLAKQRQRLAPVNAADLFTVTCPEDYDLMYHDGSVARKVSTIKCTWDGMSSSYKLHSYVITPLYGVGQTTVIPRDRDFYGFCAAPCTCCAQ